MSLTIIFSFSMTALASDTEGKVNIYVLNSFTGEAAGEVSDVIISESQTRFNYAGRIFSFPISELVMNTKDGRNIDGANYYTGMLGNLVCNLIEYNGAYCIQVFDNTKSMVGRKNDPANNFTIVGGNQISEKVNEISNIIKSETDKAEAKAKVKVPRGPLHV